MTGADSHIAVLQSPVGALAIHETDGAITAVTWGDAARGGRTELLEEALRQLEAYFAGQRTRFDLPLSITGSAAQKAACAAMAAIPFGETRTYGALAGEIGVSAQAMGQLCGGNPIPILIPCHRVMGAGGRLVGFSGAGGVETKVALLRHEGAAGLLI